MRNHHINENSYLAGGSELSRKINVDSLVVKNYK